MTVQLNKRTKRVVIHEGHFIRFVKEGQWEYVERSNCDGIVIILALTNQGKVLFVEQYRPPVKHKVIELPAGLINDDHPRRKDQRFRKRKESIIAAAQRELLEETGYKATRIVKLLEGPVSSGFCSDMVTVVRAQGVEKVSSGGGDELESIVVHEVPLTKTDAWLKKMEKKGFMIEPKVYTGLYFLRYPQARKK